MTLFTQVIIIYAFLPQTDAVLALETWQVVLLLTATSLLTASGNVINDIYDVAADTLNKPEKVIVGKKIKEKSAFTFYIVLTSIAIVAGFILANSLSKPGLAGLFITVSFALFWYATYAKKVLFAGNILISLLVAFVLMITALFELFPEINDLNRSFQLVAIQKLLVFALFAFLVNLLRESIKDCQDINGDHATGRNSLPIAIGRSRAVKVLSVYSIILTIALGYLATIHLYQDQVSLYFTLFLIMAPLMFIGLKLWTADSLKELKWLSLLCKLVMLLGIIGMAFIKFEL